MIEVEHLAKRFVVRRGRFRRERHVVEAVKDISFRVERGELLGYLGPNGAGKSTTIKMLTGILVPSDGRVSVAGLTPSRQRIELAKRIGAMFGQRIQLWWDLPLLDSFELLRHIYKVPADRYRTNLARFRDVLDLDPFLHTPVRQLSLGQRIRGELTASMLHGPELLFLDEPTIGLDLLAKRRFRELLVTLNEASGTTVFLTSHDVADIEHVAERVVVISSGTVIYDDSVAAMRRTLLSTKLVEVGLERPAAGFVLDGVDVVAHDDTVLRLSVDTSRTSIRFVLRAVLDACVVSDITVLDPPLEQVIGEIYSERLS
jgi:ABC-2 type transport system ATP-binding protein